MELNMQVTLAAMNTTSKRREVFDALAKYMDNERVVHVDTLVAALQQRNMSEHTATPIVLQVLRELDAAGFGRYTMGRRGFKSRFVLNSFVDLEQFKQIASGDAPPELSVANNSVLLSVETSGGPVTLRVPKTIEVAEFKTACLELARQFVRRQLPGVA
jgi:hypothetical protein